jgi:hypothetical protein
MISKSNKYPYPTAKSFINKHMAARADSGTISSEQKFEFITTINVTREKQKKLQSRCSPLPKG